MCDNSESVDGAVLIVSEWQINMQKKLTNVSCHRTECTMLEKTLSAVERIE